jgi:hypothetical protein
MICLPLVNTNTAHRERIDVQNKTNNISIATIKFNGGRITT